MQHTAERVLEQAQPLVGDHEQLDLGRGKPGAGGATSAAGLAWPGPGGAAGACPAGPGQGQPAARFRRSPAAQRRPSAGSPGGPAGPPPGRLPHLSRAAHDFAGLSALENLRIIVTLGADSGCRLASTRCPIAEPAVGIASSTPILLAAYPL